MRNAAPPAARDGRQRSLCAAAGREAASSASSGTFTQWQTNTGAVEPKSPSDGAVSCHVTPVSGGRCHVLWRPGRGQQPREVERKRGGVGGRGEAAVRHLGAGWSSPPASTLEERWNRSRTCLSGSRAEARLRPPAK